MSNGKQDAAPLIGDFPIRSHTFRALPETFDKKSENEVIDAQPSKVELVLELSLIGHLQRE